MVRLDSPRVLGAWSVTSPEDASGMQNSHLRVGVQGMEMRGGKEENLEMSRMQKEDGRKVKGPALQNRGQGTRDRLGVYARATRQRIPDGNYVVIQIAPPGPQAN
jgi:hypothetical protein